MPRNISRPSVVHLLVALVLVAAGSCGGGGGEYRNPVYGIDAPDPAILRAEDGAYYVHTTQAYHDGTLVNIPVLRSKDLVSWTYLGDAFADRPDWIAGDTWAPHVIHHQGRYIMYYSASNKGTGTMAIGVATADDPAGPFTDTDGPILTGPTFSTIDPFVMSAEGTLQIFWGSAGQPIRAQELTPDGLDVTGKADIVLARSEDRPYEELIEGPWIVRRDGFYYLMYSGDACCGDGAHYAVLVARSRSPLGPYEKHPDNPILAANEDWNAPGHNATVRDAEGQDWMLYHAYDRDSITIDRVMLLDPIEWVDGWPVVNGGEGPSSDEQDAPVLDR